MHTYTAHYRSPNASAERAMGVFEFQSEGRIGSRQIEKDARLAMLSQFGNDALQWMIEGIALKKSPKAPVDGQLQLDFRDPVKEKRGAGKKKYW